MQQLVPVKELTIPIGKPWSVVVLDWPEQAEDADALAAAGALRLLLVAPDVPPPIDWDITSDWIRRPADHVDVLARVETLQRRAGATPDSLRLDRDGLLWRGMEWVALAPADIGVLSMLLDNQHRVVRRSELANVAWPQEDDRGPRALDVRLQRLRARIKPLGLEIATVRQRGFVLRIATP